MKVSLFEIYKIFFIIGMQLLGGGYVIVPLLKKYIVDEKNWLTEQELVDYYAMSQCIPGIIAGNVAICAGYKAGKTIGSVMAILGIIMPSFICILLLANILTGIVNYDIVKNAFWGIRISVIVLIFITIKDLWSKSVNSVFSYILFFLILTALLFLPVSPTLIIIISALFSVVFSKLRGLKHD